MLSNRYAHLRLAAASYRRSPCTSTLAECFWIRLLRPLCRAGRTCCCNYMCYGLGCSDDFDGQHFFYACPLFRSPRAASIHELSSVLRFPLPPLSAGSLVELTSTLLPH